MIEVMTAQFTALAVVALLAAPLAAQETKPVPKDSVRVFVPGCTKGYMFTAGPRTEEHPGSVDVPEGMHFRMNGPKKLMNEIKAHEGSTIEITGLVRRGQFRTDGVGLGGGVRITPPPSSSPGRAPAPGVSPIMIDVEGWRQLGGSCPAR